MRRGQPPKIEADRYPELLRLLRSGLSISAVAAQMKVTRPTLYSLAARDAVMGEEMRAARAEGQEAVRAARRARHEVSESCYVNNGCRSPECTQAASEARARRKAAGSSPAAAAPAEPRAGGERVNVYELLAADRPPPLADTA